MPLLLAISFISAAVLGYEILLTRLFSIIQWHHFAYMIISLALLGFGASGTFLTLTQRWILRHWSRSFEINAALFGVAILGCFSLAQRIPFNALEIAWDSRQIVYLFNLYLLLSFPFFCAANCIGLALMRFKEEVHRIYRFDLIGAGLGSLGIVIALFLLSPTACLYVLTTCVFLAATLIRLHSSHRRVVGVVWLLCAIALPLVWPSSWIQLQLSEYKGQRLALRVPNTEVIEEMSSPLGLITVLRSPTIPFRYAPGLSLNSAQEPPPQLGVFTDGDAMTAITQYDGRPESLRYLDFTTSALPYHLLKKVSISGNTRGGWREPSFGPSLKTQPKDGEVDRTRPKVLILGAGGGSDVLLAKYHGIRHIDAVELNPQVIQLVQETHRDFSGNIYGSEGVQTHIAEARQFVSKSRDDKRYDLIQVSLLDSFSAASAGLHALNENYLYTVEAMQDYLALLAPDGILAINRWLKVPPRDGLKLFATAVDALERSPVASPKQQLAMIRSWKTTTLLIKKGDFTAEQINSLREFCDKRSFDVAYYPGIPASEVNRFNQLPSPYFYEGAIALLSEEHENFIRDYKFDITPATDNSPYFFHFLKWRSLPEILSLRKQGGLPLLEWGYPILIATLMQALIASLIFILLPLWWLKRESTRHRTRGAVFIYFAALGLAFLFIEIAYIQRFILFLGHPLYAVAVILCGFLLFAGLGSGYSTRLAVRCGQPAKPHRVKAIALAVSGIAAISILHYFLLPLVFRSLIPLPDYGKIAFTLILIAPLAFFMGMPFPLGLSVIGETDKALIPWAWAINGCASVLSAVLATLLAIHLGFTVVITIALGLYVLAVPAVSKMKA